MSVLVFRQSGFFETGRVHAPPQISSIGKSNGLTWELGFLVGLEEGKRREIAGEIGRKSPYEGRFPCL